MKKHSIILNKLDLHQDIKEGIRSRSSMLSSTLKTMSNDDLIQEGLYLVYKILKKKPDAPLPYIMKALNNRYSSIQKKEIKYKTTHKSFGPEDVRDLDRKAYKDSQVHTKDTRSMPILSGKGKLDAILILIEAGISFKEVAAYLGEDPKTIRRLLRRGKVNEVDTRET